MAPRCLMRVAAIDYHISEGPFFRQSNFTLLNIFSREAIVYSKTNQSVQKPLSKTGLENVKNC